MNKYTESMPWDAPDSFGKHNKNQPPSGNVQWPLKLMQISPIAPYFHMAHLLIAADCSAFSYARFSEVFISGRTLVIGCPVESGDDFAEKFEHIINLNDILSVTLVRMDAPCCRRMTDAVMSSIRKSGKDIPLRLTTLFSEGEIIE